VKSALRPVHQLGGGFQREADVVLLTETEAAQRCRYFDRGCADPVRAFQQWARRVGMPVSYVGRARLYSPTVLDAFLERKPWTLRHREVGAKQLVPRKLSLVHAGSVSEVSDAR
jgi:hypothetical protein